MYNKNNYKRIGVVGYSAQKFDIEEARGILTQAFGLLSTGNQKVEIVSGLTNLGIPGLAYEIATSLGFFTRGVAPECAKEYDLYPVDTVEYVGQTWGDESAYFLSSIDVLIRVGGGKQSHSEVQQAKKRGLAVMEFDLPALV
jgi:hypothetical protein